MKTQQHQITLDLAPDALATLKAKAAKEGKTPEEFISNLLTKGVHLALEETLTGKRGPHDI